MPKPKSFSEIIIKGTEKWLLPVIAKTQYRIFERFDEAKGITVYEGVGLAEHGKAAKVVKKIWKKHLNNEALTSHAVLDKGPPAIKESIHVYKERLTNYEKIVDSILAKIKLEISSDPSLKKMAEDSFNSKYRAYVKPDYEKAQYLIQPVLDEINKNSKIKLRKNQISWTVQAVYEGKGINAHDVGGGKTMAAITVARALKLRGRAQKPMFVVPAKTIKKWVQETKMLFPKAKIVDLGSLGKTERQKSLYDLANSDADYVFISVEGFGKIKLPAEAEAKYITELMDENVDDPDAKGREEGLNAEKIESYVDALKNDGRDTRLTWDKLGVDAIFSDEAHSFKNIGVSGQMAKFDLGKPITFKKGGQSLMSSRSYDFRFKTAYTLDNNNNSNVFMLTATPTPNMPMEIYTMLRHLGRDVLEEYGIKTDREFASMFFKLGNAVQAGKSTPKSVLKSIVNAVELGDLMNRYIDQLSMERDALD